MGLADRATGCQINQTRLVGAGLLGSVMFAALFISPGFAEHSDLGTARGLFQDSYKSDESLSCDEEAWRPTRTSGFGQSDELNGDNSLRGAPPSKEQKLQP